MNDFERSLAFEAANDEMGYVKALPHTSLSSFAVVIPSFNQVDFLAATLESVVTQRYPNVEIYVADGGSTDGSLDVLEQYSKQYPNLIRYDSRPDGGHYMGVNKGIANTSGDIIAWINSDDIYLPETFWKIAAFFHFNRGAFIVYGRNKYVTHNLEFVTDYPVDWSPLLREQRRRMMHFCLPPQPSLFFKRTAVVLCGALASKTLDYELWLRWQEDLPFYFYDDFLSLSRLHGQAITANADHGLLRGICETVHQYYGVVPYSWAFRYASTVIHGAAWTKGKTPDIGFKVRALANWYWIYLNLRWLPRLAGRKASWFLAWLRQVRRISS